MPAHFDSLLFVGFTGSPPSERAVELWQAVFGTLPANFTQLPLAGSQASGQIGEVNLTITSQPNRIDVAVTPVEPPVPDATSHLFIADEKAAIALGVDVFSKVAAGRDVQRPAVVFQRSEDCADENEAALKLRGHVPDLPLPKGASDIRFQVNVRRPSGVDPGISINRIGRWSTLRRVLLRLDMSGAPGSVTTPSTVHLAHEYVDVSPVPGTNVPADLFGRVLAEIVEQALDVLSKGYADFE